MCIQLLRFACIDPILQKRGFHVVPAGFDSWRISFSMAEKEILASSQLSCCQQVYCQSRTDWALEFCNFCIEFCKKPSRKTFLMRVFAGLCTGKVTLSYLMLQNTGQNVQKIDASAQRPIGLKMGLEKAAVSFKRTAFAVFQIHF